MRYDCQPGRAGNWWLWGISQIYYDLLYNVDWKKIVCYNV